jgi:hypothetical protein
MASIDIKKFSGMAPRTNPRLNPPHVAELALDVELENGTLKPFREPLLVHTAQATVLGLVNLDCCWITSERCTSYAQPWPSCKYIVETGSDAGYPRIATFENACADTWCRLGNPCPNVPPVATLLTPVVQDQTLELRAYRYSYVSDLDFEGGASPPSVAFNANDGCSVMLQLPSDVPAPEWCVKSVRIYRTGTPYETGQEPSNPQNTEWYLVDEVPIGTASYLDTKKLLALGGDQGQIGIFTQEEALPPPADLECVIGLENGMMAGISQGMLYMSDPFNPQSWPLRLVKKFYEPVVRIAAVGSIVYVATTGRPYTVAAKQDSDGKGCMDIYRHRLPMPIVSKRSMVAGTAGAYYASKNGLVMLRGQESRVFTETALSKTDWQKLRPNTMIGGMQDNYYFGFAENVAIRFRTPEADNIDPENVTYSHLSDRPQAVWTSEEGNLYLAVGAEISQWNAGARLRPYLWRSGIAYSPRRVAYSAAAFVPPEGSSTLGGQLEVDFISEKGTYTRKVFDENPVRLPNWYNVLFTQMELRGTAEITEAAVATTIPALIAA